MGKLYGPYRHGQKWRIQERTDGRTVYRAFDSFEDDNAVRVERHEAHIREYKGREYRFKNVSNIWRLPCVDDKDTERTEHPTQKPVELMERIIRASSPHGGMVLDCFIGSGTTGVAAMQLERICIGIDQDRHYLDIAERRFALAEIGSGL